MSSSELIFVEPFGGGQLRGGFPAATSTRYAAAATAISFFNKPISDENIAAMPFAFSASAFIRKSATGIPLTAAGKAKAKPAAIITDRRKA